MRHLPSTVVLVQITASLCGCSIANVSFDALPTVPPVASGPATHSVRVSATHQSLAQRFDGSWVVTSDLDWSSAGTSAFRSTGLFAATPSDPTAADFEADVAVRTYRGRTPLAFLSLITALIVPAETPYRITVDVSLGMRGAKPLTCTRSVAYTAWRQLFLLPLVLTNSALIDEFIIPVSLTRICAVEAFRGLERATPPASPP